MFTIIIFTILFIKVQEFECASDLLPCHINKMDYYCESELLPIDSLQHTWMQFNSAPLLVAYFTIQAKKTTYSIKLEKFDNLTTVGHFITGFGYQPKETMIKFQAGSYVDNSRVPTIKYTEKITISYDCSRYLQYANYSWVGIIDPSDDGIKMYSSNTLESQYSKKETDSILCCLVYEIQAHGDVKNIIRTVTQKLRLLYEEPPKSQTLTCTDAEATKFCGWKSSCKILSYPISEDTVTCSCSRGGKWPHCECVSVNGCRSNLACINNTCEDPCDGACGQGANCDVIQHQANCRCPLDKILDANKNCVQCISDRNCRTDLACINNTCEDPCDEACGQGANCEVIQHQANCSCPLDKILDANKNCVQCISDRNCRIDQACISNICKDPCDGACGQGAKCDVIQHRGHCSLPAKTKEPINSTIVNQDNLSSLAASRLVTRNTSSKREDYTLLYAGIGMIIIAAPLIYFTTVLIKKRRNKQRTQEIPPPVNVVRTPEPFYLNKLFRKQCQQEIEAAEERQYEEIEADKEPHYEEIL